MTGVSSRIVVTLSKKAETTVLNKHSSVIRGQTRPFASLYACKKNIRSYILHSCVDPDGGGGSDRGSGPPPPEKSQKYRVS